MSRPQPGPGPVNPPAPPPSAAPLRPAGPSVAALQPPPGHHPPAGSFAPRQGQDRRVLVIGKGISLQGVIQDAERLVVEGTVEAQLVHAADVSVAPGGLFKGEIEVDECEVAGVLDGSVTARVSLIVRATGRIVGTAHCRRLHVEDGGQINGRIEMITDAPAG